MTIKISVSRIVATTYPDGAMATARGVGLGEVTDMCRMIMNQATIDAPFDTGLLRNSHRMRVTPAPTKVDGQVYNDCEYAAAVHDGQRARTITARRARALRFEIGGQVYFRKSVRRRAVKARPWLRDAAQRVASTNGWDFRNTTG